MEADEDQRGASMPAAGDASVGDSSVGDASVGDVPVRDASVWSAAAAGLILPWLVPGFADARFWPVSAGLAFAAVLFGVVGTRLPAAVLEGRHLNAFGLPRTPQGRGIVSAAAIRCAALAAAFLLGSVLAA